MIVLLLVHAGALPFYVQHRVLMYAALCGFVITEPSGYADDNALLIPVRDSVDNGFTCPDCLGIQQVYPLLIDMLTAPLFFPLTLQLSRGHCD
jgi:hypothetical protein